VTSKCKLGLKFAWLPVAAGEKVGKRRTFKKKYTMNNISLFFEKKYNAKVAQSEICPAV